MSGGRHPRGGRSVALWTPVDSPLVSLWIDCTDVSARTIVGGRISEIRGKGTNPRTFSTGNAADMLRSKSTSGVGYDQGDTPLQGVSITNPGGSSSYRFCFCVVSRDGAPGHTTEQSAAMATRPTGSPDPYEVAYIWSHGSQGLGSVAILQGLNTPPPPAFQAEGARINGTSVSASTLTSPGILTEDFAMVASWRDFGFASHIFSIATDPVEAGRNWNGTVYDFVGCESNTAAGNTNLIERLEGWAAHKYGQTVLLPAGHTYKSTPPTR